MGKGGRKGGKSSWDGWVRVGGIEERGRGGKEGKNGGEMTMESWGVAQVVGEQEKAEATVNVRTRDNQVFLCTPPPLSHVGRLAGFPPS